MESLLVRHKKFTHQLHGQLNGATIVEFWRTGGDPKFLVLGASGVGKSSFLQTFFAGRDLISARTETTALIEENVYKSDLASLTLVDTPGANRGNDWYHFL